MKLNHIRRHKGIKMLNKQGEGKIDWCDYTWNPVSGCRNGCYYCYMQRLVKRFGFDMTPKFHPKRLKDLKKLENMKQSKIFVGSSGDIFSEGIEDSWIDQIIMEVRKYPQHIFQFLTKIPKGYKDWDFPDNCWLGSCIDGLTKTEDNIKDMALVKSKIKFVSFEPLIKFPNLDYLEKMDWIIIGANSNVGAIKPPNEWIGKIMEKAKKIPIFIKDNYKYPSRIKDFPDLNTNNTELKKEDD